MRSASGICWRRSAANEPRPWYGYNPVRVQRQRGKAAPAKSSRVPCLSDVPFIAIVDDDDAVREALFDLLQVEGLSARTFANGAALLADEAADTFDCIVTDVRMPKINGLELQRRLRARGSSVPIIFITSSVEDTTRVQALLAGAAAWFTKPVADDALLDALWTALGRDEIRN